MTEPSEPEPAGPDLGIPDLGPPWSAEAWFAPGPDGDLVPGGSAAAWAPPELATSARDDGFLRPFILTEGRTRPLQEGLRIETQILAMPSALAAPLQYEPRRIVELCQRPLSVAEVATGLGVPLGVARVLIADLAAANLVALRRPVDLAVHVIERIRDLVREL